MKYDLKSIVTFSYVAKLKSFSKAAKALNISRAIATNRIADLEDSLGIALFHRTTREVNLTNEGVDFFKYFGDIIVRLEKIDEFVDHHKGINGNLKIVLPPYFSRYHIVPYLGEFLAKYPDLTLEISLTEDPVNIIAEGYDLQVRIQVPEDEDLEVVKLMNNKKVICSSQDYIAKNGSPKNPRDLLNHNCLIFGENEAWNLKHKITGEEVNLTNLRGNIKCSNGEIIKELTLAGLGITLKSARDVEDEIAAGKLLVLFSEYEIIDRTKFYVVYPASKFSAPKIKAFIDFFQMKLSE